jgi:hypothetical protein
MDIMTAFRCIVLVCREPWPRTQRYLFAAGSNVIPHQIGGPNLARSSSQPGSFQYLIALVVDCATRLYVDRRITQRSATDELRRQLGQVISILEPYAVATGPINAQNVEVAIGLAHVYLRRAERLLDRLP